MKQNCYWYKIFSANSNGQSKKVWSPEYSHEKIWSQKSIFCDHIDLVTIFCDHILVGDHIFWYGHEKKSCDHILCCFGRILPLVSKNMVTKIYGHQKKNMVTKIWSPKACISISIIYKNIKIWSQKNFWWPYFFCDHKLVTISTWWPYIVTIFDFGDHKNMVLNFMVDFSEKYGQPRPYFFLSVDV